MLWLLLLLAVVQGVAEFLPVSSSGHLRVLEALFGVEDPMTLVDVLLHFGTLFAVVLVYRKLVWRLLAATGRGLRTAFGAPMTLKTAFAEDADLRLVGLVVAATLPTVVIGLLLKDYFERATAELAFVGVALIVNGGLLAILGYKVRRQRQIEADGSVAARPLKDLTTMTLKDALLIGLAQGAAITRGISRSGSTITAAVSLGIRQDAAAAFSFVISIPAILGAVVLSLKDMGPGETAILPQALLAAAVAGVVGYFALTWLLALLDRGRLSVFSGYCVALGLFVLVYRFAA